MFLIKAMLKALNEKIQQDIKFQQNLKIYPNSKLDLSNINQTISKLNSLIPSLEEQNINDTFENDIKLSKNSSVEDIDEDSWDVISDNINESLNDTNFNIDLNTANVNTDSTNNEDKIDNMNKTDNDFADEFEEIDIPQILDQKIDEPLQNVKEEVIEPIIDKEIKSDKKGENLLDFYEKQSFIDDTSKYVDTPYVHTYEFDGTQSENDKYIENHYAFISDFYPVNNTEVLSLLKTVRESLKNNTHTSAIDIYKHWLRYLKNYNQDYHLYDYRNFNDQGEFVGRIDQQVNDSVLDDYLKQNESVITYDEAKAKREQKEKDRIEALNILKSGTYKSEVDPKLGSMFSE